MKLVPIIHQQIMQLRWHILACLGLMMALPLEDVIVNLWQGDGFYAGSLSLAVPLVASPLLAALVACANVQADFDDRRYTFWRSKPASITSFMLLKYVIGLLAAFAMIALPFLFAWITCKRVKPDEIERAFFEAVIMVQSVSLLTYSLCFLCNVLIRKTARAWLVGMALTCFLTIIPFILPLNLKTIGDVFNFLARKWSFISFIWVGYVLTGVPSLAAFILSVVAAARNWRLHTNLKGLLWTAAGFVFVLAMLFARQVANIPILDQAAAPETFAGCLDTAGNQIIAPGIADVSILNDNEIRIQPMPSSSQVIRIYPVEDSESDLHCSTGTWVSSSFYKTGESVYAYSFDLYYREKEVEEKKHNEYEKLHLRISKFQDGRFVPLSTINLSEFIIDKNHPWAYSRQIEDKLVIIINKSILAAQIQNDGSLEIIETKTNQLAQHSPHYDPTSFEKEFAIPLVPIDQIDLEKRIRLSIDFRFSYWWFNLDRSLVDIGPDGIIFCLVRNGQIEKYKVQRWDEKTIWCRFVERRPFTLLETLFGSLGHNDWQFVKDGKLYVYGNQKLLVFDVRTGIRKLGHFVRITETGYISDVAVMDDGNILLGTMERIQRGRGEWELNLLDNPE